MTSLLIAETMTVHFNNGETIGFDTAEIEEITFEPNTSVEEMVECISQIPVKFLKNYPNPFNPIRGSGGEAITSRHKRNYFFLT